MILRRRRRAGYTLLEIILALTIAIVLLGAVYAAIGIQLRQAQAGRDAVSQTTLSRSLMNRIENDVASSLSLSDPARFRSMQVNAQNQAAQAQSQGGTSQGTTSQATTSQGGTSSAMTSKTTSSKGATTTTVTATSGQGSGTSGNTQGGTQQPPQATSPDVTNTDAGLTADSNPISLPCGVVGNETTLTLFSSKVPMEVFSTRQSDQGVLVNDVRRITYWLADGGQGLCRQEVRVSTSDDAQADPLTPPSGDLSNYLLASEVRSVRFRYFDGADWQTEWDSRTQGGDTITIQSTGQQIGTPIGSPRAIEVTLGVLPPGGKDGDKLKYYRHVIFIQTANGVTQASAPGSD
jgi:type II secretory pathway pseudopilin PulG